MREGFDASCSCVMSEIAWPDAIDFPERVIPDEQELEELFALIRLYGIGR